jgi:hypothetical protein
MTRCAVCKSYGVEQFIDPIKTATGGTAFRARLSCPTCGARATATRATPDEAIDDAEDAMAQQRGGRMDESAFGLGIAEAARESREAW